MVLEHGITRLKSRGSGIILGNENVRYSRPQSSNNRAHTRCGFHMVGIREQQPPCNYGRRRIRGDRDWTTSPLSKIQIRHGSKQAQNRSALGNLLDSDFYRLAITISCRLFPTCRRRKRLHERHRLLRASGSETARCHSMCCISCDRRSAKRPNDSEEQLNVLQDSTRLRALSRTGFVTGLPSAKLNLTIIASLISIRQLRGQGVSNRCR